MLRVPAPRGVVDINDNYLCAPPRLSFKVEKARSWFNRSVTLNPDLGDHWALYYKFEQQHGTDEQQAAVVRRCVAAEPRHGELWCRVRKAVKNWHDEVDVLLTKAIAEMAME